MTDNAPPLRVLLVENSADDAELVQRTLREGGIAFDSRLVASEPDFRAALQSFLPELILADWALPGFSGGAAVAIAYAWDPAVPCILVSGALGEEIAVEALRSGATDYVLKQRLNGLVPAVRRALAEAKERRKRANLEAELAATQAAMARSLDAMHDPFLICASVRDQTATITGFRAIFANRAAQAFMGRMPDLMTGAPTDNRFPLLGGTPFFETFLQVVETGDAWAADAVEFEVPGPGGSRRSGIVNIQVARSGDGFFATWQDVTERERLRLEHERLAAALEQTSDGVAIVGLDSIVTYANPALLASRGLAREEMVGRHAQSVGLSVLGPDGHAAMLEAISADRVWRRDIDTPGQDGSLRHLEIAVTPVRDATARVTSFVVMSRDVTERDAARKLLEASEERLRTALDTMLDGVTIESAVRDDTGRIVDFRVDYANSAVGEIGGTAGSLQMGRSLFELFPAHRVNGLFDAYVRMVETSVPFSADNFWYVDPGAAGGPLDQVLDLRAARLGDGFVLSVRDVSERHRAEREMRKLATAVEQSADAVVITDASGAIEYVNPAFERSSGYSRDEVVGQNPRLLKSGVQSPAFYAAMWTALTSGSSFVGDLTNRRKDGRLFQEEAVISPIRDAAGAITNYVAVKRDVTRERASEVTLTQVARERAQIAETLADLRVLPSPAATATEIARHVVRLAGIATARIAYFTRVDPAIPLAFVRADGVPAPLARVPLARARVLRDRVEDGPWVEAWVGHSSHPYDRLFRELGVVAAAHAPIRHHGTLIGLLSVSSAEPKAIEQLTEMLPALLEFAGAAGALLGPAIIGLTESGEVQVQIAGIIGEAAFRPVFQPIADLTTGTHAGYEALTRFSTGIRPDLVFADAHAVGLGAELEMATLASSIRAAAVLPTGAWLSLNVSPGLVTGNAGLSRLLQKADRPVVLEVTEHVSVADYSALRAAIDRFRPAVRVAVDDAGSGVANFGHIVELRPAFVKLDIGLVRGIDSDLTRQALMVGLLHFARSSASQTIAEGVETEAELSTLRALGVPLAQGYLLGRPAAAAEWADGSDPAEPRRTEPATPRS